MQPEISVQQSHRLTARLFDFIDIHPSQIKHLSYNQNSSTLCIGRKHYSQIYLLSLSQQLKPTKPVAIQQLLVLQPCQHIYQIDGYIVLVMPYQLRVSKSGKWYNYPFTTQLLPLTAKLLSDHNQLITFHVGEARLWTFSEDDGVHIKHLNKNQIPYHINSQGLIQGYGKKIKPNGYKQTKFTVIGQVLGYLFAGTNKGQLSVYQTKYMTHVKTFHRHQGAILTIKCRDNICYFTGSDSKISSIVYVDNQSDKSGAWALGNQVRGQSHDILALELITLQDNHNFVVSGGITTDLCLYQLSSGNLTQSFFHIISYSSQKLTYFTYPYLLVNKHLSFQLWKINPLKQHTELLVKYQVAFYKSIHQILMKKSYSKNNDNNNLLIFILFQDQGILWEFDEQTGLKKMLTVKNQYNVAAWYSKQSLITIRDSNKLEIFNYKTGNIRQVTDIKVQFPTDLRVSQKGQRILIASKYSNQIQIYQLMKQKSTKRVFNICLQQPYDFIDFCYYNPAHLMVKKFNSDQVYQIDRKGSELLKIVKLPFQKIRDFGWLPFSTKSKNKLFWYAVGQSKIAIVSRMKQQSLKKKVRVKQMPRIGNVVINNCQKYEDEQTEQWNIGVIPLNFSKMIERQIMPIMTKKIL